MSFKTFQLNVSAVSVHPSLQLQSTDLLLVMNESNIRESITSSEHITIVGMLLMLTNMLLS